MIKRFTQLGLFVSLLLGAWLRFGWVGISSFSFDEARVSDMALLMVRAGDFAELGMQSSAGIPNFPAAVWLFALPYALSTNPQLATWFAAGLNVLAIWGIYWLGRETWGKVAGVVGAFLFAVAPFMVFYSRSIWSQNLLAPFAVLWAVAAVKGIGGQVNAMGRRGEGVKDLTERRIGGKDDSFFTPHSPLPTPHSSLWLGVHFFLCGFIAQIHFAGASLALASLYIFIRFKLWSRWMSVFGGGALAVLTALPTIYLIGRYGDGAKADIAALQAKPAQFQPQTFRQLLDLGIGQSWENLWLSRSWTWGELQAVGLTAGSWLLVGLLVLGILVLNAKGPRSKGTNPQSLTPNPQPLLSFILPWLLLSPLLFLTSKANAGSQYQLASVPALFLLMGAAANWLNQKKLGVPALALILTIGLFQANAVRQTLDVNAQSLVKGGMGTPLRYPQSAVSQLSNRVVVESFGNTPEYDGDAASFKVLLWGKEPQLADARNALIVPRETADILFLFDTLPAYQIAQQIGLVADRTDHPRRDNEPPYVSLRTEGFVSDNWHEPETEWQLNNGATFKGWQIVETDNRLRLITQWQLTAPLATGQIQQFNHLYLDGGSEPFAVSDVGTSSSAWRDGDTLITWADFDKPAEPAAYFHIGMYTWPDLQRSAVVNRDGDPFFPITLTVD